MGHMVRKVLLQLPTTRAGKTRCYWQGRLQFEAFIFLIRWEILSSYCICLSK